MAKVVVGAAVTTTVVVGAVVAVVEPGADVPLAAGVVSGGEVVAGRLTLLEVESLQAAPTTTSASRIGRTRITPGYLRFFQSPLQVEREIPRDVRP